MKVLQLNSVSGIASTGRITEGISRALNESGIENRILYSAGTTAYANSIKFSNEKYTKVQALKSRVFGNYGFHSQRATKELIAQTEVFQPDIVHIHNIHGHDCDLKTLFSYFKRNRTKLVWTLHDCWSFTAYCPYFDMAGCEKWKTGCSHCPQYKTYSWFFDRSPWLWQQKKELFSGLDMTLVTPSQWLADLVKQSFLRGYDIRVIHNGIDLDVFKPMQSDFRSKHHLEDKFILLGVSFDWCKRKGLDVFAHLAQTLPDPYKIVLVGTNEKVEQMLPSDVLTVRKTDSASALAEIYSTADLLVNPTREENFPTVNIESLACGTPVLTFATGGSGEIPDTTCGHTVPKNDITALQRAIEAIYAQRPYTSEACVKRAQVFDQNERFGEYVALYRELI